MNSSILYIKHRIAYIVNFIKNTNLIEAEKWLLSTVSTLLSNEIKTYNDIHYVLYTLARTVYTKAQIEGEVLSELKRFVLLSEKTAQDLGDGSVTKEVIEFLLTKIEVDLSSMYRGTTKGSLHYIPYKEGVYSSYPHPLQTLGMMSTYRKASAIKPKVAKAKVEEVPTKLIPSKIISGLDEYAIGQDEVKKQLAVYVSNHYNSFIGNHNEMYKQSLLILGETGTGKTLLVKSLGRVTGKPVHIVDITEFSKVGYVGKDVSSILADIKECKYPEPPIVFIDEFDKLSGYGVRSNGNGADMMNDGVQNSLLKLIEGDKRSVTRKEGPYKYTSQIETSELCFVFGGSFQKMVEDKKAKVHTEDSTAVGFQQTTSKKVAKITLTHTDLIEAGIKSELVGRIGMIIQTEPLTHNMWMSILTKPKGCVKDHFNRLFKDNGLKDKVTDKDLKVIIKKAKGLDLGARGLWAIAGVHFADRLFY